MIWRIVTGKRTRQDDPELLDLTARVVANFKSQDPSDLLCLLQFNSLSFTKLCRLLGLPNFLDSTKKVKEMIDSVVDETTADECGNYVEKALSKRESDIAEGKETFLSGNYAERLIAGQLMDLFFAGTETTSTMVEWTFMYLAKYPELQERMFQEIKSITGDNERRIGLVDKPSAHFCNAFTDEVSRHCQMATLPPSHKAMNDVYFQGKFIPKGTQVIILQL